VVLVPVYAVGILYEIVIFTFSFKLRNKSS
jgi:hypothetical protein